MTRINFSLFLYPLGVIGFFFGASIASVLSVPSTPISLAIRGCTALLAVLILTKGIRIEAKGARGLITATFFAFWILYIIRITFYTTDTHQINRLEGWVYWSWALGACLLPSLVYLVSRSDHFNLKMFNLFFSAIYVISLLLLTQASSVVEIDGALQERGRIQVDSINPISIGRIGAIGIALSLWMIIKNGDKIKTKLHWFFICTQIIIGIYLLISSASRGPLIACLIALLILTSTLKKTQVKGFAITIALTSLSALATIRFLATNLIESFYTRTLAAINLEDRASAGRMKSYDGAINVFSENPWWGKGFEEPNTGYYPHNIILEAFMSTGIFGGMLFCILILLAAIKGASIIGLSSSSGWIGVLFFIYLVQAMFTGSLYQSYELWITIAAISSIAALKQRESGQEKTHTT